jgi:POT family proton-dependent oligopeptide transporter
MKPGSAAGKQREWFGHPAGLTILFLTDMWEKFSYFGLRALLIYYMTKELLIGQQQASMIYGLYTAAAYFTPIVGGIIADRFLDKRAAVITGGSIMALGHFIMASTDLFYYGLAAIAIGNGLFLPSLPSQIAGLYRAGDPRVTSAYSVYYVGTNVGAFLAPLLCGTIGELYGWHWGFGLAGVGMIAGLVTYNPSGDLLRPVSEAAEHSGVAGGQRAGFSSTLLTQRRFLLLIGIVLVIVVFRSAYEQVGNTVALWADEGVDRVISNGSVIPMTWFQSIDPLMVFILTPVLLAHWARLRRRGSEPSTMTKMSIGALVVAIAYSLLSLVADRAAGNSVAAHWIWLATFLVIYTAGELYILPVGFGLFGRLAPKGHAATTLAIWYAAIFAGSLLGGALGTLWSSLTPSQFFLLMAAVAAGASLLLLGFNGAVSRTEDSLRADGHAQIGAKSRSATEQQASVAGP